MTLYRLRQLVLFGVTVAALFLLAPLVGLPWRVALGFTALGCLGNLPGLLMVCPFGFGFALSPAGRILSVVLTVACVHLVFLWLNRRLLKAAESEEEARKLTRRALIGGGMAGASFLLTVGYGRAVEARNLERVCGRLWLPDLPKELEGLRVALIADWHCGPFNSIDQLRPAMHMVNECKPDLILVPGDFISRLGIYFEQAAELASMLKPRIPQGVLINFGNHDYWHEGTALAHRLMPQAGCQILTNSSLVLDGRRNLSDSGKGLWLAGLDDLWAGKPDMSILEKLPADQPRLVLCHNPDVCEEQQGPRIDLMVSGHTHGGQVRIPVLGPPIVPSRYGAKYSQGLVQGPDYPVYVTRGLGVGGVPIRLGARPEVTLFELAWGERLEFVPMRLC